MKHVTIKHIARKLNVSISTVSRAFNDKYDIRPETRDLILKTAEEMGYFPNPIAKKLSQQKTLNIGVVVPEFINEFYAEIIVAIQEIFIKENYQVLVMQSDNSPEIELNNVKTLIHSMVDGLIIAPTLDGTNMNYYLKQIENECPIVFVNRVREKLNASKVIFDNKKWSYFATDHLIRQGYKKIYHLSAYKGLSVAKERIDGFLKAMKNNKVNEENYKVIETGLLAKEGMHIVEDLIYKQDMPNAFFCANDPVAMGVMKTLKDHHYKIPEDIGVMGFTNTQMAELVTPQLCSVKQPTYEMGKAAAELLLHQIQKEDLSPVTKVFNGKLMIRSTSVRNQNSII